MTTTTPSLFHSQSFDFHEHILNLRFADAVASGASRYPIFRKFRLTVRGEMDAVFDAIAGMADWTAHRYEDTTMLLDGGTAFLVISGASKAEYTSCTVKAWASSVGNVHRARESIVGCLGESRLQRAAFSVDWCFANQEGELKAVGIEEMPEPDVLDEAYPDLSEGVDGFIGRYLASTAPILVMQGPPGTGKTRFVRRVLQLISEKRQGQGTVLYTGDHRLLAREEIFVRYLTGRHDAMVIEDADHFLVARAKGNDHLHRFLAAADGVVRAQGRKIIFTTNLPNLGDLDDALIRPGRCFSRAHVRELTAVETKRMIRRIVGPYPEEELKALAILSGLGRSSYSVAHIYQACFAARAP